MKRRQSNTDRVDTWLSKSAGKSFCLDCIAKGVTELRAPQIGKVFRRFAYRLGFGQFLGMCSTCGELTKVAGSITNAAEAKAVSVERIAKLGTEHYQISVSQDLRSGWSALGDYRGNRIEGRGRTEAAAIQAWREHARYKTTSRARR